MKPPEKAMVYGLIISFVASAAAGLLQIREHESRIIAIEKELDERLNFAIEHIQLVERVKNLESER